MLTLEAQTIARACGKSHVHNLEPEDLVALTVEAAAMARVPLAGTDWIPGSGSGLHEASRDAFVPRRKGSQRWRSISRSRLAKENGIKYFLISFVDLFGTMRAKIVPATAIDDMAKAGAGFAGFATWLDMTPADPDILAMPDPDEPDPAALEARGRLGRRRPRSWTASRSTQDPRQVLKRVIAKAAAQAATR